MRLTFVFCLLLLCSQTVAAPTEHTPPVTDPAIQTALDAGHSIRIIGRLVRSGVSETSRGSFEPALAAFEALAGQHDIQLIRSLARQGLVVFEVVPAQWPAVTNSGLFTHLQADGTLTTQALNFEVETGADLLHFFGYSGNAQAVAVLDTGVDSTHPYFGHRVVEQACFSTNYGDDISLCPNQQEFMTGPGAGEPCDRSVAYNCGHGTHVAGIAAGAGDDLLGLAPAANIIAIQVFHYDQDSGRILAHWSDLFSALDWLLYESTTPNLASVNISIGGERHSGACDSSILADLIAQLRLKNVATVVSSGNNGWSDAINHPGCISQAVTVGASDQFSSVIAGFTNLSELVDVLAPGQSIRSALPGGLYGSMSGTSMSAPQVAGAFAIMRNAYPNASVDDVETAFKSTGRPTRRKLLERDLPQMDLWASFNSLGSHLTYKFEAEDQPLPKATAEQEHPGFSGRGYANGDNATGASLSFRISVARAGRYKLKLRYANGGSVPRPAQILINGTATQTLSFASTGAWHNWSDALLQLPLQAGNNTLTLVADSNGGLANLDYLLLNPNLTLNQLPYLASAMADLKLGAAAQPVTLALNPVFTDDDGDALQYSVSQSENTVAAVAIAGGTSNPYLAITPQNLGETRITVTASDGEGSASTAFTLTIVAPPAETPATAIAPGAINLARGAGADGSSKASGARYGNVTDGDTASAWQPAGQYEERIAVKWASTIRAGRAVIRTQGGAIKAWRLIDESGGILLAEGTALPSVIEFAETETRKLSFYLDQTEGEVAVAEFEVYQTAQPRSEQASLAERLAQKAESFKNARAALAGN